jgi:hypothetical protein
MSDLFKRLHEPPRQFRQQHPQSHRNPSVHARQADIWQPVAVERSMPG